MSTTNTRAITKLEVNQAQPETTVNGALDNLDKRDQILSLSGQTGGTVTLTSAQALNGIWAISGVLTSNLIVKYPASGYTREVTVYNGTSGAFTVTISPNSGGSGYGVIQGGRQKLYFDSVNVTPAAPPLVLPRCRVTHNANQSIAHATPTALAFNTELYDNFSIHDTVTNNSRLVLPRVGLWAVFGHVRFAANSTGGREAYFKRNGDDTLRDADQLLPNAGASLPTMFDLYAEVPVTSVTDYVELIAYQESGGALNVESALMRPSFGCHFICE